MQAARRESRHRRLVTKLGRIDDDPKPSRIRASSLQRELGYRNGFGGSPLHDYSERCVKHFESCRIRRCIGGPCMTDELVNMSERRQFRRVFSLVPEEDVVLFSMNGSSHFVSELLDLSRGGGVSFSAMATPSAGNEVW